MIERDQPRCFDESVVAGVSSRDDGSMLDRSGRTPREVLVANRQEFCEQLGLDYDDVVNQQIIYGDNQSYERIVDVDERHTVGAGQAIHADTLITREPGVGLFLPIADCIGAVLHEPTSRTLVVMHLGRHSTTSRVIDKLCDKLDADGVSLTDATIWMSPSIAKSSYRMDYFDPADERAWRTYAAKSDDGIYIDIAGYNRAQFVRRGVPEHNIHLPSADTATDPAYFSHSSGDTTERFAIVAMMKHHD